MNAIDSVWISVIAEWIDDQLTFGCLHLAAGSPSASWCGKSEKSTKVVILEVDREQQLRLKISW